MNLQKRAITVMFLAATILGALGAPAMAAPMPWETSGAPALPAAADGHDESLVVTVRCAPSCQR